MNTKKDDNESKLEFLIKCYSEIILESSLLYDFIEEQNINWVNDFPYVNSYLIKNIEKIDVENQIHFICLLLLTEDEISLVRTLKQDFRKF